MKKDLLEKVEIPEGVEVEISGNFITVKSGAKEIKKELRHPNVLVSKKDGEVLIEAKKATKKEGKMVGTIKAHIVNMVKGMQENFVYKLEVAYVHFPMTVEISGDQIMIKNFLGEKKPRVCKIIEGTEVSIDGKIITVESHNKELAGQMAANLEKATKIRKKDVRKFQDGIYITEKCGRAI